MDASENEIDVYLHKHSKVLLDELDQSLATCLRKPDGRGGTRIRRWVRIRETLKATCVVSSPEIARKHFVPRLLTEA